MNNKKIKKTIFTLNFDNYLPEITHLTYPFIEEYAQKIDADFNIITKRQFPDYPLMYEKLQLYELGKDNDWNIYIDSDVLVHPDLFDITEVLPTNVIMTYGVNFASSRFKYDNYFRRDGRNGACSSFLLAASKWCLDVWHPLDDISLPEALNAIHLTQEERRLGYEAGYLLDDYAISRNVAKFGLKYKSFIELLVESNQGSREFIFRTNQISDVEKLALLKQKIKEWGY